MTPKITILTPLYNRENYIERLYYCLCAQTVKDFQWLIIDDGSENPSHSIFEEYKSFADFDIEYIYKENGGKHTALNYSHPYIKGDWVLILDSDDLLCHDAVESALTAINKYESHPEIGVISFQKGTDRHTSPVKFDDGEIVSDHIEYRINGKRLGDCCEIVRSSALREYPFPVYTGERYLSETHLWMSSADKYKTVYIPKIIYIYEYLEGGLTKEGRSFWRTCPKGCMHSQIIGLNPRCSFVFRAKKALLVHYYGRILKMKTKDICRDSGYPRFVGLFTLPGLLLYHIWERKYK